MTDFLKYGKFECQKDIHFKTQPGLCCKKTNLRWAELNCSEKKQHISRQDQSITFLSVSGIIRNQQNQRNCHSKTSLAHVINGRTSHNLFKICDNLNETVTVNVQNSYM